MLFHEGEHFLKLPVGGAVAPPALPPAFVSVQGLPLSVLIKSTFSDWSQSQSP